ncbi:MAG: hypothetical protein AB7G23_05915 [Vicinamibacterales bacterium]
MAVLRSRASRFLIDSRPMPDPVFRTLSDFYREEFLKCQRCLEQQREHFSAGAMNAAEQALARAMQELDHWCEDANAGQVVSRLLRQFDAIAGVATWSERTRVH